MVVGSCNSRADEMSPYFNLLNLDKLSPFCTERRFVAFGYTGYTEDAQHKNRANLIARAWKKESRKLKR